MSLRWERKRIDPDQVTRRTVYLPIRRGSMPVMLSMFDFGDATTSGDGRSRTNVAPQALFMMNSEFALKQSVSLAAQIQKDARPVERAYLLTLGRAPLPGEVDKVLTYLQIMEQKAGSASEAWKSFCHVLLASNEFLYVD